MSPKKDTQNGGCKFDACLQSSKKNTTVDVTGFGKSTYELVTQYQLSKRPLRFTLFPSTKPQYPKPTLNERSGIKDATLQQVPYDFNGALAKPHTFIQHPSIKKTVADILESRETDTYYTIQGMVLKPEGGIEIKKAKDYSSQKKIKDNNTFIDETGQIPITLWDDVIHIIHNEGTYEISHVKLRSFQGHLNLTTCYPTKVKTAASQVKAPTEVDVKLAAKKTIQVTRFSEVGLVESISICRDCMKNVEISQIRKRGFSCTHCHANKNLSRLEHTYKIDLIAVENDEVRKLHITKEISEKLKGVLGDFASPEELGDKLTYLENFEIEYNEQTNEILNINTSSD